MRYLIALVFLFVGNQTFVYSQNRLSGKITNQKKEPLAGSHIHANGNFTTSDPSGGYFIDLPSGKTRLVVSFLGYKTKDTLIDASQHLSLNITLQEDNQLMKEVVVKTESLERQSKKNNAQGVETVNNDFIHKNLGGSLMQSLERIGGISTISIGSGQSKPVVRGLGFNRVVVAESGVKHEGQQWGSDHGLEIDQFAVETVKVVKGPASLMFGSDAIGGVIEIEKAKAPKPNTFAGSMDIIGKSNNNLYGTSLNLFKRNNAFFFDSRITYVDYADYRVPVDHVNIYSYKAPLYKNRLRNTAGNELNLHFTTGIVKENFESTFYISNLKTNSGLFANAHGLEPRNVDTGLHDASDRDIQNPSQKVNHFKLINRTKINFISHKLEFELGFQNNFREEFSDYISHGFMPPNYPENLNIPENLERGFNKNVYSLNVKDYFSIGKHTFSIGNNTEHQNNNVDGWGFIVPDYKQFSTGFFAYDKIELPERWILHAGLRYDYGRIETQDYFDWFQSPVVDEQQFLQRSTAMTKDFKSLSWSIGANYNTENVFLRANLGKSFRMPIAKELASNGVNYHQFSYELGNPNLSAEKSYQLDLGLTWEKKNYSIDVSPFVNFFPNYIYLNPTPNHDYSYGAGNQIFNYTENKVLRYGGEIKLNYTFSPLFKSEIIGEYVYSEQTSGAKKGFTLPFSPPPSVLLNLSFTPNFRNNFQNSFAGIDFKHFGAQNNIVPPEEKTPAYQIINFAMGTDLKWNNQLFKINFQIQNLLDAKNLNHTSFYRLIGVPEPGRNFVLSVKIPFMISKV